MRICTGSELRRGIIRWKLSGLSEDFHFRLGHIGQYVWQQEGHDL